MQNINDIIRQSLLSGDGAYLPSVGALCLRRTAGGLKGQEFMAPTCEVILVKQGRVGVCSVVDYIVDTGVEREAATQMYHRWLEESTCGQVVDIEGVGSVEGEKFHLDPAFDSVLNPDRGRSYRLKKRRSLEWLWFLPGVVAIIVAAVILGRPMLSRLQSNKVTFVAKSETIALPAEVAQPETTTHLPTEGAEALAPSVATPATQQGDRYYVVFGVFSEPANADKMVDRIRTEMSGLDIVKLPYGDKVMVTIYSSSDHADAVSNMRKLRVLDEEVWIYHRKGDR